MHKQTYIVFWNDYGYDRENNTFAGTNIGVAYSDDGLTWHPQPEPWIDWKDKEIRRAYDPRITII